MRTLPSKLQSIVNAGGPFTGDNAPQTRITVDANWWLNASSGQVGTRAGNKLPIRWFQDDANSQFASEVEIPNLKMVTIDRQLHQVAGTIEVQVINTVTPSNGSAGPNSDTFGDPGYYSYARGNNAEAMARWHYTANAWQNLLRENALLRVYQGYGGADLTLSDAVNQGYLILDGVFLVDHVQIDAASGIITLNGRDMAKLLVDQYAWPPTVPQAFYTSSGIVYFRTGQNGTTGDNKWHSYVTQTLAADRPQSGHPGSAAADGSASSFWLSEPYNSYDDTTNILFTVNQKIGGMWINPFIGNYLCYVSIWDGSKWATSASGGTSRDGIPYVEVMGIQPGARWYAFREEYQAVHVRLEFTNLQSAQTALTQNTSLYIVQPGDNLSTIAAAHNMTLSEIENLNTWIPGETGSYNLIYPGMKVTLAEPTYPSGGTGTYTVQSGDNLWDIALAHNMTLSQIEAMNTWIVNGTTNPNDSSQTGSGDYNLIYPGWIITIANAGGIQSGYVCGIYECNFGHFNAKAPIGGNYNDYADIVSDFLLWAGFWLYPHSTNGTVTGQPLVFGNIESTGAYNTVGPIPPDTFDKLQLSDCITAIAQVVGYIFRVDEIGAARFESPNWWSPGNFTDEGAHTNVIPVIDELLNMTGYVQTTTDASMVSEIIVAPEDPYLFNGAPAGGTGPNGADPSIVTRLTPSGIGSLRGINKPTMIGVPLNVPVSPADQEIFAELLAVQSFFANRQGQVSCWHHPAICVDDQIKIYERSTAEANIHYVTGVHVEHDLKEGTKLATYTTYWLGNSNTWVINANQNSILAGSELTNSTYDPNGVLISQQLIDFLSGTGSKKVTQITRFSSQSSNPPAPPASSVAIP